MGAVRIQRVYDDSPRPPGARFLVDRVWPRGVRKADLALDGWPRSIAPSTELRKWFGHCPERFAEFRRRYRHELSQRPEDIETLLSAARRGPIVLLYGARDELHNQAVVLQEYLKERISGGSA